MASLVPVNPHIAARLKERADIIRNSHSAYWMGEDMMDLTRKVEAGSLEYVERLRKVQRATANFVQIVTGKDIPVVYSSGQQSYTDGKHVVLSADLDPAKMDSLVGCALHEGAHCLLSNESLAFLPFMHKFFEDIVRGRPLEVNAKRLGIPLVSGKQNGAMGQTENKESAIEHVQMVMNVLEDRRIDLWMYQEAPGYRPYYDSLYNLYWHSKSIDEALTDPKYRDMSVQAYIMFIINMTNTNFDQQAMPGLEEIRKIAGLNAKTLESRGDSDKAWKNYRQVVSSPPVDLTKMPKLFADAVRIVEIMYEHATKVEGEAGKSKGDMDESEDGDGESDLPNMDASGKMRKATPEEVRRALKKQKKFLKGDLGKKQIDENSAAQLDQMNKTNASVMEVEGEFLPKNVKAKVIIFRDITKEIVMSDKFPFRSTGGYYNRHGNASRNSMMEKALADGTRMGMILANRIRVMQDERPLTFTHQEHGRLDKRRLHGLGHGIENVFQFTVIEKKKPANLWMDIDFSGSMAGDKARQAMTVAIAIAKAAELTRTLNTTIAIRDGGAEAVQVAILYDSRKHSFNQLRSIVPYLEVGGGTPESLAFEAVKDEMLKMYGGERKFFINLSDGEPGHGFQYKGRSYSYGGEGAYKHTRMLMNEFRAAGIQILSYYIGYGDTYEHAGFKSMYGQAAVFIDPSQIGSIVRTVNKLLLTDEAK